MDDDGPMDAVVKLRSLARHKTGEVRVSNNPLKVDLPKNYIRSTKVSYYTRLGRLSTDHPRIQGIQRVVPSSDILVLRTCST